LLRKAVIDEIFPENWTDELTLYKREPSHFTPTKEQGKYLLLGTDAEFNRNEISKFSKSDAENYDRYEHTLNEIVDVISPFLDDEPGFKFKNVVKSIKEVRKIKSATLSEIYQILTAPCSTILNQYFETDILKGSLANDAVIGANKSPFSPNSSYVLIHHAMGEVLERNIWTYVQGGMGTLANYIGYLAEKRGATIAVNAAADEILIDPITKEVEGVKLVNGQVIKCKTVITNCTNNVAYNLIKDQELLPPDFQKGIKNVNYEGVQVKFNLILNDIPRFKCLEHLWDENDTFQERVNKLKFYLQGTIRINTENMEAIHEAYVDYFNGTFSKRPVVEMAILSVLDPTLTPPGSEKLVAVMFVQFAPYNLKGGRKWDQEAREEFIKNTFDIIDEYAPNFSQCVEFKDVLFPPDLQEILNLTGGNIFHGALDFNNVFISRPMPNHTGYQWPVKGLWSCGSSNHPGGGVSGAPGRNCALKVLKAGI